MNKKIIMTLIICFCTFICINNVDAAIVKNPIISISIINSETGAYVPGVRFDFCKELDGCGSNGGYSSTSSPLVITNIAETESGKRYLVPVSMPSGCSSFETVEFEIPENASGQIINVEVPIDPVEGKQCVGYEENVYTKYKIRFKNSNGDILEGVEYSIWQDNWFADCSRTPSRTGIKSTVAGYSYSFVTNKTGYHYWIKTTNVPEGYNDYKCTLIKYPTDSEYIDITLNSTSEGEMPDTVPVQFLFGNDGQPIAGVKYAVYQNATCSGNPYVTGTTPGVYHGYGSTDFLPVGTWSFNILEVPDGYMKISCQKFNLTLNTDTTKYDPDNPTAAYDPYEPYNIMMMLPKGTGIWTGSFEGGFSSNVVIPDDNSGSSNESTVTTGSIKINVTSDSNLSNVEIKICKTSDCKNSEDVLFSNKYSSVNRSDVAFGTYYLVVTNVPEGYTKPEPKKITLDATNYSYDYTLKLDKKVNVPDTLLDASKIFTIAGLIGIIAGISLLYFNNKKKEA